jgi:hypothetical protein
MNRASRVCLRIFSVLAFCVPLLAAAAAPTADATGTWQLNVLDAGRTFTPTFILKQSGTTLSGTYRNSTGELPAAGTIDGNRVELKVQIKGADGQERTVVYTGVIEGDSFTGDVKTSRGGGTFTSKRAPLPK